MEIDEQSAAGRSDYQGQTYYFCSQSCKKEFDQNGNSMQTRELKEPADLRNARYRSLISSAVFRQVEI
jgi:YHS domain-containing protein